MWGIRGDYFILRAKQSIYSVNLFFYGIVL